MCPSSPSYFLTPSLFFPPLFASGISVWVCLPNAAVAGGYQGWIPTLPASHYGEMATLWQRRALSKSRKERAQGLYNKGQWHTHTHPREAGSMHTWFTSEESFQCSSGTFIMQMPEHKRLCPPCRSVNALREDGLASRFSLSLRGLGAFSLYLFGTIPTSLVIYLTGLIGPVGGVGCEEKGCHCLFVITVLLKTLLQLC